MFHWRNVGRTIHENFNVVVGGRNVRVSAGVKVWVGAGGGVTARVAVGKNHGVAVPEPLVTGH